MFEGEPAAHAPELSQNPADAAGDGPPTTDGSASDATGDAAPTTDGSASEATGDAAPTTDGSASDATPAAVHALGAQIALAPARPRNAGDAATQAGPGEHELGDFTMSLGALRLVPLALVVGAIASLIALILLDLIGFFTNLLYYGRLSVALTSPAANQLGWLSVLIPVAGGLVIGVMARYGSERIRGHGIPEAMETILVGGSKVEPRLAILKPISSAISIGSGGPFGAEGPIILTGGAFGSLVGQSFHLSAAERKTLLVAGAAAGMTAVFATPVASVLFSVELLLFEWKPRSLVPVATASALAAAIRIRFSDAGLIASAPLFPVPAHPILNEAGLMSALVVGIVGGFVAWLLTVCVYGAEDAFKRLPIHWMWWPAIGGLIVGLGGLIDPRSLGVGYDSIRAELAGQIAVEGLLLLLVVKLAIWSLALGSGTSGGILAPLLLMGGAVGGIMAPVLPGGSEAIWCLVGMSAALAGVTRSPFTGVIFAFELTHDQNALLPLLIACVAAYAISVLALKRSILTEKVARRGFHVMREYAVDPLEALFVRDVMATTALTLEPGASAGTLLARVDVTGERARQRLFPVVADDRLVGVIGRSELIRTLSDPSAERTTVAQLMQRQPVVAYADETLRMAADRMAARRVGVMPVVDRADPGKLLGLVAQIDLLRARERILAEERHRERVLRMRPVPRVGREDHEVEGA
jgi:H+/Cl- antiporter ClcA/CBS domain-containing protein